MILKKELINIIKEKGLNIPEGENRPNLFITKNLGINPKQESARFKSRVGAEKRRLI